jgi:hypothetical protein
MVLAACFPQMKKTDRERSHESLVKRSRRASLAERKEAEAQNWQAGLGMLAGALGGGAKKRKKAVSDG